jgi:ribosomal protein S12 methylthiotransferase
MKRQLSQKNRPLSHISNESSAPAVGIISLGCPKNLVDSEIIAGYLQQAGFSFTAQPEEAQVIIVNTCSFIAPAVAEAKQTLRETAKLKAKGVCRAVICAGCLTEREGASLAEEFPEIDAFVGVDDIPNIVEIVGNLMNRHKDPADLLVGAGFREPRRQSLTTSKPRLSTYLYDHLTPRALLTPPWTAYVKIADGCSHRCSFCTIPSIRGKFRSRQPDSVVREVKVLAARGVKEVVLIGQDTTAYGRDIGANLAQLLTRLDEIEDIRWIRLMYSFPNALADDLLETIADSHKICHYLDLPLQHAHPRILKMMHRPGSGDSYLQLIAHLREMMPIVALRSCFIVGFPGETDAEFEALLDFLQQAQLDRVGAFVYCREPGTPAAELDNQVPEELAQERYERLMLTQQEISLERNRLCVGKEMEVLVERVVVQHKDFNDPLVGAGFREPRRSPSFLGDPPTTCGGRALQKPAPKTPQNHSGRLVEKKQLIGRSYRDAPEIDGEVILKKPNRKLYPKPGEFTLAEITEVSEYDLFGRIAGDE